MRFDGDQIKVIEEAGVARVTAVCASLRRWKHWGFKRACFLRFTNPTADIPIVWCYEERRYEERSVVYIGEFRASDAVPPASLAMFFFPYPYGRVWFIDGMVFWCRDVDFEVRRRAEAERPLTLHWLCVDVFVISTLSRSEVFLSLSMAEIDSRERSCWLPVPDQSVWADYSGFLFHQGAATRLFVRISQFELVVMTALQFLHCVFYDIKEDFGLGSRLVSHDSVLMYFPSAVAAHTDKLALLHVVRGTNVYAATSIVTSERPK